MQRRQFLTTSSAAISAASINPWSGRTSAQNPAGSATWASEDLAQIARETGRGKRVGLIGCGWYGKCDLLRLVQVADVEVVSMCDVDRRMLGNAIDVVAQRQVSRQKPRGFHDYRQMLAERDLDLVLIATPDHWHALPMIAACVAGADVYVQKPVGVDVMEGEAMLQVARKTERVVQVGTQRRSTPHLIDAKQRIIDQGKLGAIGHAEVYCYYHMRSRDTSEPIAVPDHLDFDFWTGPAPMLPFRGITHPRSWRAFMEYGNGIMGDMCVHMLDMVRWILDLGWPKQVHSIGGVHIEKGKSANITDSQTATFTFDDLSVVWQHRSWGAPPDPRYPWGATIYGEKGTLKLSVNRWDFEPFGGGQGESGQVELEFAQYPEDEHEPDLERHVAPAIRRHMQDWLAATAHRTRPVADILQGHISSSACVLANQSLELGRSLVYDPATRTIPGDEEATERLARNYRAPWTHPQTVLTGE
ncbi:MAG: Gfo/Idh/MocA family oxidoreductase [Pirellulaceae bacterium]|nr:Gfo/Idh/MocA family oxidoreductase [Pirellulaceae bacterium]